MIIFLREIDEHGYIIDQTKARLKGSPDNHSILQSPLVIEVRPMLNYPGNFLEIHIAF